MQIIKVTLQNITTNEVLDLTNKVEGRTGLFSKSLFVTPFNFGAYEIKLRFDYKDINRNGDPTLDANIFLNGKEISKSSWHHTPREFSEEMRLWIYTFKFNSLKLELQTTTIVNQTISGRARIVKGPAIKN